MADKPEATPSGAAQEADSYADKIKGKRPLIPFAEFEAAHRAIYFFLSDLPIKYTNIGVNRTIELGNEFLMPKACQKALSHLAQTITFSLFFSGVDKHGQINNNIDNVRRSINSGTKDCGSNELLNNPDALKEALTKVGEKAIAQVSAKARPKVGGATR